MFKDPFILQSFGHFLRFRPIRIITLFLTTLIQGFSQGITIVLLIPLLSLLDPTKSSIQTNKWTLLLNSTLERAGLQLNLNIILILFLVCLTLVAFLNYYQLITQSKFQQDFSYETRRRIFKKIITSDWTFLNGKSKHNHIQVLTTEIPKMTTYYYYFLGLTSKILFISAHILLATMISFRFTLSVVIIGLTFLLLLKGYINQSRTIGNFSIQIFRGMLKRIDDFWLTVKISKVHQSELFYFEQYDKANRQMLENQLKQTKNKAVPQLIFTLAGILTLVVVVYLGYSVIKLPMASLFVLILLFTRIFPQFSGLNNDLNMLVSLEGSVRMVLEMDQEIVEKEFGTNQAAERIELHDTLEIKNLNFAYNPLKPLFNNFSTIIPAKKITGIIGKSGSGKTTLIDIIAGLQKTGSQTITIDGEALPHTRLTAWKQSLGYLPQDSFFIDGTLRENLIWDTAGKPNDEIIFEVLKQVNAENLVLNQKNGLDTYISNYQYHFSGGERQRLALARVLLRAPKLLLLDEATSALDTENEKLIMDSLTRLKKDVTIIFVTHRDYLKSYFDHTINLNR